MICKDSVEDILLLKSSYNINDVKNILIDLSFINDIKIDMIIEDGFFNSSNVISIENGDVISSNEYLFKGDNLKKVFPDINLEIRRIFQNLVKNSKEAGSTNISITFGILLISGRLVIKYVDNGTGMTYNIIKDVLFKKGFTTKIDSGTNKGEGMHGLSKIFYENEVDIDIYSRNLDSGFVGAGIIVDGFNIDEGKDNISGIVDITKTGYYKEDFPFETGTEFVLKFKQK